MLVQVVESMFPFNVCSSLFYGLQVSLAVLFCYGYYSAFLNDCFLFCVGSTLPSS